MFLKFRFVFFEILYGVLFNWGFDSLCVFSNMVIFVFLLFLYKNKLFLKVEELLKVFWVLFDLFEIEYDWFVLLNFGL